jgi:DNA processing protein
MLDSNRRHLLLAYALQVGLTQRDLIIYSPKSLQISLDEWVMSSAMKEERRENIRASIANTPMQIIEDAVEKGYKILLREDSDYPQSLVSLSQPPELLWARGNIRLLNTPSIAIVGSRKPTQYTQRSLERIIPQLVESGYTIVS